MNRPLLYRLTVVLAALCKPDGQPVVNPAANCTRLARDLEVSPRTVQRDLDLLRDDFALPIEYDPVGRTFRLTRPVQVNLSQLLVMAGGFQQKGAA